MKIQVHNSIKNRILTKKRIIELTRWLCDEIKLPIATLDIIFTDDEYLRKLHEEFLENKDYTDVMTFNLGNQEKIEGEIYISRNRARDNALTYDVKLETEICRLIIHACLHLAGYNDSNDLEKEHMKNKEDSYLSILLNKFLN
jgi:rRNA maturation RNase YbeY